MLNCHYFFRNSLCLILTLSLILLPAGCGEKSENTDSSISIGTSNEADSSLSFNAADTALPQGTETPGEAEMIEDKFVMLQEVYDILSGPLGEPYRTPEYWGGEEIDMMKVGDGYLIGLRNSDYQMHYLLYEREKDSIIEIDTQGKHIPWDEIYYYVDKQELSFPYYISDEHTRNVRKGAITYSLADHSYQYTESDSFSLARPENLFEIPGPVLTQENQTYTFDFLADIIEKLPELYFSDFAGWSNSGQNICILHHKDYTLIRLEGQWDYYYVYQTLGNISAITPLDIRNAFWDVIRFQQDEEYLVFPSPSGQEYPYAYWDSADFPYTTLISLTMPTRSEKQETSLWREDERVVYQVGKSSCHSEWRSIGFWDDSSSFSIRLTQDKNFTCDCAEHAPQILVEINPDRTVSVWFKRGKLSDEIQQEILSCQMEGIADIRIRQDVSKEYRVKNLYDVATESGDQIEFTLCEGYQLYGNFYSEEDAPRFEGKLELITRKVGNSREKYYQISNYQYLYSKE